MYSPPAFNTHSPVYQSIGYYPSMVEDRRLSYPTLIEDRRLSYHTMMEDRPASYCEYLSSSSQASFSDYEQSPVNVPEEYHTSVAGQQQYTPPPQKYIVPSMNYNHLMPSTGYYAQYDYVPTFHHEYNQYSNFSSPSPSTTTSSPVMSHQQEQLCGKKKTTTRANKKIMTTKKQPYPDTSNKLFECEHQDCGKVFKRSEHLKRHNRSIHTREKRKCVVYIT